MTVYIVTPFRNMSLAARTKQWTARNLQKLCARRDPVPTFVPEYIFAEVKCNCVEAAF